MQQAEIFQNCENLNVNYTNMIQSEGIFLGIDLKSFKTIYASTNFPRIFNYEIYRNSIDLLFTQISLIKITNFIARIDKKEVKPRIISFLQIKYFNCLYDIPCAIYISNSVLCIEFQSKFDSYKNNFDEIYYEDTLQYIKSYSGNIHKISHYICKYISEVLNFERAYLCEFLQDNHGYVSASFQNGELESLLHHHFPASDLPLTVRNIYMKNKFRLISNIDYFQVPIEGCKENIDLTLSFFRDIGKSHLTYLKNMELKSSASFSIVLDGKLYGIFGCHSKTKNYTSVEILSKIQVLIDEFSRKILLFRYRKSKKTKSLGNAKINNFIKEYENAECNLEKIPNDKFEELKETFDAKSFFYRYNNKFEKNISVPYEFAEKILGYLNNYVRNDLILIDKLIDLDPIFEQWSKEVAAGIIVIKLNEDFSSFIVFLRPEYIQTIKWSGNPNSYNLEKDGTLNPRSSFATWYQETYCKSKPWSSIDFDLGLELQTKLISLRSNYLAKSQLINRYLNRKIIQKDILLTRNQLCLKNIFLVVNSTFTWSRSKYLTLEKNSQIDNQLFQGFILEKVDIINFLINLSENISYNIKESFFENINFNLDISEKSILPINQIFTIALIILEFIHLLNKHSLIVNENRIISIKWQENASYTLITLHDNSDFFNQFNNASSDIDLIKFLINQLNGEASWEKNKGVVLKIILQRKCLNIKKNLALN
ncbi:GAF domain-containing protein [Fluviispira vulneris]|uniref:GAF domain-containing protein n=1 Tax=Fluviispira vulneris TaxID=2763012 RepID=UPI001644638F|nr:GAF domain-containing protein [Fluviispira vulneris]